MLTACLSQGRHQFKPLGGWDLYLGFCALDGQANMSIGYIAYGTSRVIDNQHAADSRRLFSIVGGLESTEKLVIEDRGRKDRW